jgi:hypothetical protein
MCQISFFALTGTDVFGRPRDALRARVLLHATDKNVRIRIASRGGPLVGFEIFRSICLPARTATKKNGNEKEPAANKGRGTPKNAVHQPPRLASRRCPEGSTPSGVPPRLSPEGLLIPKAQSRARLPGTQRARAVRYGRPNRGAETLRGLPGAKTRPRLSQSSEAPHAPVIVPAGMMPGPPECGSDEPPPAGTAPAPPVGSHPVTSCNRAG